MLGSVIVRVTSAIRGALIKPITRLYASSPTTPSTSFRFAHRERAAARVASTPVPILAGEPLTGGGWLRTRRIRGAHPSCSRCHQLTPPRPPPPRHPPPTPA